MATYPSELIYAVRVMIPDAEAIYGPGENENLFEDKDIEAFLMGGGR